MHKTLTAAALTLLALATPGALAQPANDDCSGATAVIDGDNVVDNTNATQSVTLPGPCLLYDPLTYAYAPANFSGMDVWYTYTASVTGVRNFEIINNGNSTPTTNLAIYDGCGGTLLACNTSGGQIGNAKIYHFNVTAGTTYTIRYAHYQSGTSSTTLNISAPQSPIAFDDCALATPIAGQGSFPFTTAGLTNSDVRAWDCDVSRKDGWFAWTPSATGIAVVSGCTATTAIRLKLSAYASCGTAPLICNSNFQETPNCSPKMAWNVIAGQTYIVRFGVGRNSDTSAGNLVFDVRPPTTGFAIPAGAVQEAEACSNDPADEVNAGCAIASGATVPAQLCVTYTGTATARRTNEIPQAPNSYLDVDSDVYEFTLDQDDTITLTGQSEFFPRFMIRVGCEPPTDLILGATNFTTPSVSAVYDLGVARVAGVNGPFTASLVAGTYHLYIAPMGLGMNSTDCSGSNRYWFKITGSQPCAPANESCCRGTTCISVAAGTCTGSSNGTTATPTALCGGGNTVAGCCFADYTKTNGVNIDDIFVYLNAWFASSPYAKFNGDGVVTPTIDDIFIYLNAWFAGCT